MNRDELVKRLEELDPSDDYHFHEPSLDAHSYYAAIDRAVKIVSGELINWTSNPEPKHEARKPHPNCMAGR